SPFMHLNLSIIWRQCQHVFSRNMLFFMLTGERTEDKLIAERETIMSDKTELCNAIDAAITRLEAIKAKVYPSSINDLLSQVESAEAYSGYVMDIEEATSDLRIRAVEIASALGNQPFFPSDTDSIRENEVINDILEDIQSWCDEVREGSKDEYEW